MGDIKKRRTNIAKKVTRRINELLNGVKNVIEKEDIVDKINNEKYAVVELGVVQDELIGSIDDDANVDEQTEWYDGFDVKANLAIKEDRRYLVYKETSVAALKQPIKLQKLEIPKFHSDTKSFFRWKEKFERYTAHLDPDSKYDYLFTSTTGDAYHYVENKNNYKEAMEKLEDYYGNVHTILGILIDEIKALPIVRNRDFKSFVILSFHVNDFHDRLKLMGLTNQADNSYVLKELEGKLNQDDLQRWLESLGNRVEQRRVEQLMTWLENQTKLRRISNRVAVRSLINFPITNINTKPRMNITYVGNDNGCMVCLQGTHDFRSCPKFLGSGTDEKWDIVKKLRLCFQCLSNNHHRDSCTAPKCKYCARPHDSSLHNIARTDRNQEPSNYMGKSASYHMKMLQNKGMHNATSLLFTGSKSYSDP